MSQINSLKKTYQFQRVFREGKSYATKHLVLFIVPNHNHVNRIGFITGKKVGNSVTRNRIKRLMREAFRTHNHYLKQGYDMILLARHRSREMDYWMCQSEFIKLAKKSNILSQDKYHQSRRSQNNR